MKLLKNTFKFLKLNKKGAIIGGITGFILYWSLPFISETLWWVLVPGFKLAGLVLVVYCEGYCWDLLPFIFFLGMFLNSIIYVFIGAYLHSRGVFK